MVARLRVLLQYREAALAGFGTQLFWGLIRVMLFDAFYRSTAVEQPMTYSQTVTYLWLIQAMLLLIPMRLDNEIVAMIRTGTVAYELARPTDLYWNWFSRSVASRVGPLSLRAAPMFIVAGLFFGLEPPASLVSGLAFVMSAVAALLLSSTVVSLMTISMLWTVSGDGISRLIGVMSWVLAGAIVPLPLMPDWAQATLNFLPFRGIMDTPFRLYMGHAPPAAAVALIGHQAGWILVLILFGRWLLSRGRRRLVVQGG
jgi:ABC-2 type transport system permease protein